MIVDEVGHLNEPHRITLITDFDSDLFKKILIWGVGGPKPE